MDDLEQLRTAESKRSEAPGRTIESGAACSERARSADDRSARPEREAREPGGRRHRRCGADLPERWLRPRDGTGHAFARRTVGPRGLGGVRIGSARANQGLDVAPLARRSAGARSLRARRTPRSSASARCRALLLALFFAQPAGTHVGSWRPWRGSCPGSWLARGSWAPNWTGVLLVNLGRQRA